MKRHQAIVTVVVCGFMAVPVGRAAGTGDKIIAVAATTNLVATVLSTEKSSVALGDPIKVSLNVDYRGDQKKQMEASCTAFDCFEVIDPQGQSAVYVGFNGQIMSHPIDVAPSSTVVLAKDLDLADKYLFDKTGNYSIRFRGEGNGTGATTISPPRSNLITVETTAGQVSELDGFVAQLLPIRPQGWVITKSEREQQEVTPFGRRRVAGYGAHICRNYMRGEAVYVWLTKAEAPVDPAGKDRGTSEEIGLTHGLHVYITVADKAKELWPTAMADISRVLRIQKE